MSRRDHGPKRRAERYAQRIMTAVHCAGRVALIDAYMAGYRSASRARRTRIAISDADITSALEMLNKALGGTGRPGDHE